MSAAPQNAESFLDRRTLGIANWLCVATLLATGLAMTPQAAWLALRASRDSAAAESSDAALVVVSPGDPAVVAERLRLLQRKLLEVREGADGWAWYPRVVLDGAPARLRRNQTASPAKSQPPRLVAHLAPSVSRESRRMDVALARLERLAEEECGLSGARVRIERAPLQATAHSLGPGIVVAGFGMFLCLGSGRLAMLGTLAAALGAGVSVAVIYYLGVAEVFAGGSALPRWGTIDALTPVAPALALIVGTIAALELLRAYRATRVEEGQPGAVERAAAMSWGPVFATGATISAGVATLAAGHADSVARLGVAASLGIVAALAPLFALVAVVLHKLPPRGGVFDMFDLAPRRAPAAWSDAVVGFAIAHRGPLLVTSLGGLLIAARAAAGVADAVLDIAPLVLVVSILLAPRSVDAVAANCVALAVLASTLLFGGLCLPASGPATLLAASVATGVALLETQRYLVAYRAARARSMGAERAAIEASRRVARPTLHTVLLAAGMTTAAIGPMGAPLEQLSLALVAGLALALAGTVILAPALASAVIDRGAAAAPTTGEVETIPPSGTAQPMASVVIDVLAALPEAAVPMAAAIPVVEPIDSAEPIAPPHFPTRKGAPPEGTPVVAEPELSPAAAALQARLRRLRRPLEAERSMRG
jgi:hypothetical protein